MSNHTNTEGLDPVEVRQTVNAAIWLASEWGIPLQRKRARQLVIHFLKNGRVGEDFRTWFTSYLDPTGEKAVRNVAKGKS